MLTATLRALDKLIDFSKPYLPKVGKMVVLKVCGKNSVKQPMARMTFLVITRFRIDNKWSKKIHLYAYVYVHVDV